MFTRTLIAAAMLIQLGGCVITPRIEISERLDFDRTEYSMKPLSYNDVLCCYDCRA